MRTYMILTLLQCWMLPTNGSLVVNNKAFSRSLNSKPAFSRSRRTPMHMVATNDISTTTIPPRKLLAKGMELFKEGDIEGSIEKFDQVDRADSALRPFLWQRGISYYYANRFKEGSDQFRYDVRVNPADVEEIVWDIACLSQLNPKTLPPPDMMSLPRGRSDRRKIMSAVYSLFRGEATEQDLALAGHRGNLAEEFYANFYLGLYCESRGELSKAEKYMTLATKSNYATGFGAQDYMTSVARVHCQLRGWA